MSTAKARNAHARAILGEELFTQLSNTKVLLVGAGGIGCELLKNIVLVGFGHITLLDLDTIDLSNLNRQFLFRKKDVKQSKAVVAAQTAGPFNPNVKIKPLCDNIKDPQYDVRWYKQFDLVLNALDNLDARRHVNKMCMAAEVPLVESGTAGYLGQVQPILKDKAECFDCVPKPTPKSFPVCTIRSTPSQPIHCIVWSKSYLLNQLFGEDEDAGNELDEAEKQGENANEIAALRQEAQAFKVVRDALRTPNNKNAARLAFDKVFNSDIENLLKMGDMWRNRKPPTRLYFDEIRGGTFRLEMLQISNGSATNGKSKSKPPPKVLGPSGGLKDQKQLSLLDNLELFVSSTQRLASRLQHGEATIPFDKDDDDTLDFVTASSNLRSAAYGIERKTRWEVKEMAGNIIPAIATTNAVVSGLIVLQALQLLRKSYDKMRNVHLQFKPAVPLSTITMSAPNPKCGVCRDTFVNIQCDTSRVTLGEVVKAILKAEKDGGNEHNGGDDDDDSEEEVREVSVYEDKRVLSDPDWTDNYERTLESLNVTRGKFLAITDEDDDLSTLAVSISNLPTNHPSDGPALLLPTPFPRPTPKTKPPPPRPSTPTQVVILPSAPSSISKQFRPMTLSSPITSPGKSLKRAHPDKEDANGDVEVTEIGGSGDNDGRMTKRQKKNNGHGPVEDGRIKPGGGAGNLASPSKRRQLEEDGLVLMESVMDQLDDDDDVIIID